MLTLDVIDPDSATESELGSLHDLYLETEAEMLPGEPPVPLEERIAEWRHRPSFEKDMRWVLRQGDLAVGSAVLRLTYLDQNRDKAWFYLQVRRDRRRHGLATTMLPSVLEAAAADGRTLLSSWTWEGSEGEGFLDAIGCEKRLRERISRLWIRDVDLDLMRRWIARAPERASDYELVFWEGPCPEDLLAPYTDLTTVMNTAPLEDFQEEDWTITPAQTREWEAANSERDTEWWTLCAQHTPSGRLAGYTQLFFSPYRHFLAHQGDTGVDPQHRNRGLGRWLKAAMLLRLLEQRPTVDRIDTGNAGSNAPMLAINEQMGFRPLLFEGAWQVPLETARLAVAELEDRHRVGA